MQKWPVVNEKQSQLEQEYTVYVWTALNDKCKIVFKTINNYRNIVLAATWLDGLQKFSIYRYSTYIPSFVEILLGVSEVQRVEICPFSLYLYYRSSRGRM